MTTAYYSTTPERRALIYGWFPQTKLTKHNPTVRAAARGVLSAQGYEIDTYRLVIRPPTPSHAPTAEQKELLLYLMQEWQYDFRRE